MIHNKVEIYEKCHIEVDKLIEKYQQKMDGIKNSMEANDVQTGYDEEGGNGELLGDFERYATHLNQARLMKEKLAEINETHYSETIRFGSLVETDEFYYFIAIPLGLITMNDGRVIHAISTEAPIFQELEGKKKGDKFKFNDEEVEIEDVG